MTGEDGIREAGLSADRPSTDPKADRLGYAPFAKRLAESILRLCGAEGHVIALYGPWGSGKTTLLNYVRHYVGQGRPDEQPIVVPFNPWWFAGSEDLISAFFKQLQAQLEGHKEFSSTMRERLADFAELVSDAPVPHATWAKIGARVLRPKAKDIVKLKNEVSTALEGQTRRILVIIDDIDRLTSEEIRQVFRAVKAVADFPKVTYLLAFDKRVVTRSLGELQSGFGEDYLEKIVQVPFELPLVDRLSIRNFFFEKLNPALSRVESKTFDQTYWGNIFFEGIDKFLETPRDVVRFTNTLAVTLGAVSGEVNPIDFIAIESLRIFCPEVYEYVKNNRQMFTGHGANRLGGATAQELREFHDRWLGQLRELKPGYEVAVKNMLMRLFPKLKSVWGNTNYGPEWEAQWRRDLRVCSEDIFPTYFTLTVATGELSNSEMEAILTIADSSQRFGAEILKLAQQIRPDGKTRANAFLDRLQDFTENEISLDRIEPVVFALWDIGDQLVIPEDERSGSLDYGNDVQIGRVNWQLLKRLDAGRRFETIRRAFEVGRGLFITQRAFIALGQQQGLYGDNGQPEQEWYVTRDQLTELGNVLLLKIRRASEDGSLLNTPGLPFVLSLWREKGGEEEVRLWVQEMLRDDAKLVELLEKYLQTSSSFGFGDAVGRKQDRLDPEWLRPYADPEQIVERVRALNESNFRAPKGKRAVQQFVKEYDFRKKGGNPNSPFYQRHGS
jgi:predicted KAP-like P-loop ATPase